VIPDVFPVSVPGIGDFIFRKRRVRDQVWIEADALKTFGGLAPAKPLLPDDQTDWTDEDHVAVARWLGEASLWELAIALPSVERLTVTAPPGWNLDGIDPLERDQTQPLLTVYRSLRKTEDTFRTKPPSNGAAEGVGVKSDGGVLVPAPV
jgi:hypothetical protein